MKKFLALILIVFLFCGCQESEQINELAFVKILAIDKSEAGMLVTAGIQPPKTKEGETQEGKNCVSVECRTLSEGLNLLEAATDKKMFFGQISCVLFGEELARDGVIDTVDYLVRSDELRFDIPVIVVRGEKARRVVEEGSGGESHISEKIVKLLKSNYSTSSAGQVELAALVEMLEDPFRSPYLPYLLLGDEKGDISVGGYCIFTKDMLCAFFDEESSLGINFLNNNVENWVFVTEIDKNTVCVKLSDTSSAIRMKEGIFYINIDFKSEVLQADSGIEEFDHGLAEKLIERQNGEIIRIVTDTMELLKEYGCDVATFGDTFHNVSPRAAEEYMNAWGSTFSQITYRIKVTSKLDPSKNAGKPVKEGGEE